MAFPVYILCYFFLVSATDFPIKVLQYTSKLYLYLKTDIAQYLWNKNLI